MSTYYKMQLQLQKEQIKLYLEQTLEALLRTKLKYIHFRKIKVQNGNKLTCRSLQVVTSAAIG